MTISVMSCPSFPRHVHVMTDLRVTFTHTERACAAALWGWSEEPLRWTLWVPPRCPRPPFWCCAPTLQLRCALLLRAHNYYLLRGFPLGYWGHLTHPESGNTWTCMSLAVALAGS